LREQRPGRPLAAIFTESPAIDASIMGCADMSRANTLSAPYVRPRGDSDLPEGGRQLPALDFCDRTVRFSGAGGYPRPQELTATVLFSDIAGFTTICECLPPEPLVIWLDRYIDVMVRIVTEHEGLVLRLVGDGILAVFGATVPQGDEAEIAANARNAVRCGLAMEAAMAHLNTGWREAGLPEAGLRIGIYTGPLVAGYFGSGPHMEFCVLGDTANIGARLEQLGKEHAGPLECTIMLGRPTWERLGDAFPGFYVGELNLRGKQARMAVWRIDAGALSRVIAHFPRNLQPRRKVQLRAVRGQGALNSALATLRGSKVAPSSRALSQRWAKP
jgi:class 3 adenylate cyclase